MSKVTVFRNCSVLRNHEIVDEDLWIQVRVLFPVKIANSETRAIFQKKGRPSDRPEPALLRLKTQFR